MEIKCLKDLYTHVINCGYIYTDDIFIVPSNVYLRVLETKQHTTKYPHGPVTHLQVTKDRYMCWSYYTNLKREIDSNTYYTQLKLYNLMKTDKDFYNSLLQDVIIHNLTSLAFKSSLIFNQ